MTLTIETLLTIAALGISIFVYFNNRKKTDMDIFLEEVRLLKEKLDDCKKLSEESQKDLEARLSSRMSHLLDMLPSPIALVDENGIIEDCNYKFSSRFGYMVDEIRDKSLTVLIPMRFQEIHSDGFAALQEEEILKVLDRNKCRTAIHKDGTEIEVDLQLSRRPTRNGFIYAVTLKK